MEGEENCYSCHNKRNYDQFILLTGRIVEFDESHLVCWQCHGDKKVIGKVAYMENRLDFGMVKRKK